MLRYTRKIEQAVAEGLEQGLEQGREQGIAAAHQQWQGWNARRMEAEAKGEPFNEPPPTPPVNGGPRELVGSAAGMPVRVFCGTNWEVCATTR